MNVCIKSGKRSYLSNKGIQWKCNVTTEKLSSCPVELSASACMCSLTILISGQKTLYLPTTNKRISDLPESNP